MMNTTRTRRESRVTTLLEARTHALRALAGTDLPRDQVQSTASRYARACGLPPVPHGSAVLDFLQLAGSAHTPIEDVDDLLRVSAHADQAMRQAIDGAGGTA